MRNKLITAVFFLMTATALPGYFLLQKPRPQKKSVTPGSYESYWNKVDSLQKKGLSKSALEVIGKIYDKSKADNNMPQLVKSVIHRMKFQSYTEEDAVKKIIAGLEKEINNSSMPVKALLHSMLAETYWN